MDKRQTLTRDEALALVRRYKEIIRPRFANEPRVMMFGSYSKGYANPDSDIDVAVIVLPMVTVSWKFPNSFGTMSTESVFSSSPSSWPKTAGHLSTTT